MVLRICVCGAIRTIHILCSVIFMNQCLHIHIYVYICSVIINFLNIGH